jgi:CxxH/CxxC protein (TIGR04129 family)
MENKKIYACDRHLDKAFDEFLDKNEVFPYLEKVIIGTCSYCDSPAEYVLKLAEEEGSLQLL